MPQVPTSTGLTITNPLVLYRALVATKQIEPDPAQHRLALHLQKLYHRLKDYEPQIDFSHRIDQLNRLSKIIPNDQEISKAQLNNEAFTEPTGIFSSRKAQREKTEATALTKRLTDHDSAIQVQSPQGLLLYGEVGTGKSLLVDLLADCLPNRKKRRWHFNTFMLDTFARLEQLRRSRYTGSDAYANLGGVGDEEHSLLYLARDMISTSPILFLDEFQLPDRAASKILSNLLTCFFHLGGVMIATSNRMPEELANAAGIEFSPPPASRLGLWQNRWGLLGRKSQRDGRSESMFSGKGDFALFLDVLKARCEIWDMGGDKDWRRREIQEDNAGAKDTSYDQSTHDMCDENFHGIEPMAAGNWGLGYEQSAHTQTSKHESKSDDAVPSTSNPKHYCVRLPSELDSESVAKLEAQWENAEMQSIQALSATTAQDRNNGIPWQSTTLRVYNRPLPIPRHLNGTTKWTFAELCATNLGPADYITLASTFHTVILTDVPVLTLLQKNEARRLITLLDALYEARCKLLVSAEAGPDDIFFPEKSKSVEEDEEGKESGDGVYSETLAEIYQDTTSPFRPNISSYIDSSSPSSTDTAFPAPPSPPTPSSYQPSSSTPNYAPTTSSPFSSTRSILADEDSDFGPVYGAGRSPRGPSDGPPGVGNEIGRNSAGRAGPDFTQTGAYTGEDERFAYKRARSRLWEMCGARWWAREGDDWWRPLSREQRPWEGPSADDTDTTTATTTMLGEAARAAVDGAGDEGEGEGETLFRHNASPFRTSIEPPPKFAAVHAWGMMRWGRKAGLWGQGVDGLGAKEGKKEEK